MHPYVASRIGASCGQSYVVVSGWFSFDILRNEVHRSRTVKRDTRYDILKTPGLQLFHEVLHPRAFKLKDTLGLSGTDHRKHSRIIIINGIDIKWLSRTVLCQLHSILDHREGAQSQKIHFQQSQLLQCGHRKLW